MDGPRGKSDDRQQNKSESTAESIQANYIVEGTDRAEKVSTPAKISGTALGGGSGSSEGTPSENLGGVTHIHQYYGANITANIVATGSNAYIEQTGGTNIVGAVGSEKGQETEHHSKQNKKEISFIEEVRRNLLKQVDDELRLPFKNFGKPKTDYTPRMAAMVQNEKTDFSNAEQILTTQGVLEKKSGVELNEIELSELHEKFDGEGTKVIHLVGNVGSGKTVTSKRYAKLASKGKIKSLAHVELVHHVQVYDLPDSDNTTALELLFVQSELSREQKSESEEWFSQKSKRKKTLLVLDGLDQSAKSFCEKDFRKVRDPGFRTSTNAILANLLSGQLYEGINILSTSRWLTYWKLKGQLRAAKVVVLKGFSESNVSSLLAELVGYQPDSIDPTVLSLCKDPVFLVYLAEILIQKGDLPEIFSEMMVLVIRYFIDCGHNRGDVSKLMKLAYHGMKDKRYSFSAKYLQKYGISVEDMKDLINVSAKRIIACSQPDVQEHNLVFAYQHQSLQEVSAALHSFTLEPEEFRRFVAEDLKEESMVVVRRELYGIILNERTQRAAELFTEDANCSLEECRQIVLKDLKSLFQTNIIDNTELVLLLYECGSSVSPLLERIQIIKDMIWDGTNALWLQSVINQCTQLQKLQFKLFIADSNSSAVLESFLRRTRNLIINVFSISDGVKPDDILPIKRLLSKIDIQLFTVLKCSDDVAKKFLSPSNNTQDLQPWKLRLDRKFETDTYRSLAHFVAVESIERLDFSGCSIEDDQFKMLVEEIPPGKKISTVCLNANGIAAPSGYYYLAKLLSRVNVVVLAMINCKLTDQKLDYFNLAAQKTHPQITDLEIQNETMLPSAYRILASTVEFTKARSLILARCHLKSDKLRSFNEAATQLNVQVDWLQIVDSDMEARAFADLAATSEMSNRLVLQNCGLTVKKLRAFTDAATNCDINLMWLILGNENLQEDAISILPEVISVTRANGIALENCNLNGKVQRFAQAAEEKDIQVERLQITNEDMHPEEYAEIAHALHVMRSDAWIVVNCHLTNDKLQEFNKAAEAVGLQLSLVCADREHNMPIEEFAQTIAVTKAQDVQITSSDLSKKQFRLLRDSLLQANAKVRRFYIRQENITEESFPEIAGITDVTKADCLSLDDCLLNPAKMMTMSEALRKFRKQFRELMILRVPSVDYKTFEIIGDLIKFAAVKDFIIGRCGLTHSKLRNLLLAFLEGKVQVANAIIYETEPLDDESFDAISAFFQKVVTNDKPAGSLTATLNLLSCNNSLFEKVEYFAIANKSLSAIDMKYLAMICRNTWLTVLWLHECDPTKSKLDALYEGLKSGRTQVPRLILSQIIFKPSEDDIIALARLLSVVRQKLMLIGWQITTKCMSILQEAVDESNKSGLVIEVKNCDQIELISRSSDDGFINSEDKISFIGPNGGRIEVGGCLITFPSGCFDKVSKVHTQAEIDSSKWPPNYICITAMLWVESQRKLLAAASVKMTSWCMKDCADSRQIYVHVLHQNNSSQKWDVVARLPLNDCKVFSFDCTDFSPYVLGIHENELPATDLVVESHVYAGRENFTLSFFLQHDLIEKSVEKAMAKRRCELQLNLTPIPVKIDDTVSGNLHCMIDAFRFINECKIAFKIDKDFVRLQKKTFCNSILVGSSDQTRIPFECKVQKNEVLVQQPQFFSYDWVPEKQVMQQQGQRTMKLTAEIPEGATIHHLDFMGTGNIYDHRQQSGQQNQTPVAGSAVQGAAASQPGTSASSSIGTQTPARSAVQGADASQPGTSGRRSGASRRINRSIARVNQSCVCM